MRKWGFPKRKMSVEKIIMSSREVPRISEQKYKLI